VGEVLASICDCISPASPALAATPKTMTMKIQANLRLNLVQKVGVLVGFLPGLAKGLLLYPSPGIISPHGASPGRSSFLIP